MGPWPAQNRVPGLIGPLLAPNGILRASPGRKSQGGVDSGPGLAPGVGKEAEMSGYPGRVGPDFRKISDFSRNGPEWLGKAWGPLFGGLGEQKTKKLPSCGPALPFLGFVSYHGAGQISSSPREKRAQQPKGY